MDNIEIRPRFQRNIPTDPDVILENIRKKLDLAETTLKGQIVQHHVILKIPQEEQHYWSPQLSLSVEDHPEGGSFIRGLYGPRPSVWLMFVFFYSFFGFVLTILFIWGISKWSLGQDSTVLWLVPIGVVLIIAAYITARFGQRLGHDQMVEIQRFLNEVL